jgi:hypothetical protein
MSKNITLSSIKLNTVNKELEQKDGYYKINLGAVNSFNESGEFYLKDGVEDILFGNDSAFAKTISNGYLTGEADHPSKESGMNKQDFLNRILRIDKARTSHSIREIGLKDSGIPCGITGKGNQILIEGWVKPLMVDKFPLKERLDDPYANVSFSIRALTINKTVVNILYKKIVKIVTWDWVTEPGIRIANKMDKLSLESIDLCTIDIDNLKDDAYVRTTIENSLESDDVKNEFRKIIEDIKINTINYDILTKW